MSTFGPTRKDIHRLIGQPRLSRYKAAAGGDRTLAFELYKWNVEVSSAFLESMHYFEIAFRNMAHDALQGKKERLDPGGPPWYRNSHFPLQGKGPQIVNTARNRATNWNTVPEVEGRVVAELTFGFWANLASDGYNRLLWKDGLAVAFPEAKRKHLHGSLSTLVTLRNRTAHHEPIHTWDLHKEYQRLLGTSEFISPRLAWWIDSTSRIPDLLTRQPRP